MKQLLQSMRDGKTLVVEVPTPQVRPGTALVRVSSSLVSAGTERMLVNFASKNLLGKAKARPDFVKQVLDKARREGITNTIEAAFNRLDQPMPLGYSTAGTIVELSSGMSGFKVGDRVSCAGTHAHHAEFNVIPRNLLAKLPDAVDFDQAAFATLGAIAMQGFRLAKPQIGEKIAVIGLGLLGLITLRIANAAGCFVFGVDLDPKRVKLGRSTGATCVRRKDAIVSGRSFTQGKGFDSVLICADTSSSDTVTLAGELACDRGKVISTGVVGLDLPRKLYYEKELSFRVSRSSGPGRYDVDYEEKGLDYPYGFVRWTEGRNLEAFIDLLSSGKIEVKSLISHRFPIDDAAKAYKLITGKTTDSFLGVLLDYPKRDKEKEESKIYLIPGETAAKAQGQPKLGVLGAGNYASAVFLPSVKKVGRARLEGIASASGVTARHAAQRFGFSFASAKEEDILASKEINLVAILTRHDLHARQVITALKNGKHVYCEKPLATNEQELKGIAKEAGRANAPLLMVGFNRRFAPMAVELKKFLATRSEPLVAHYRVNAGLLPANHWLHDPKQGGGRIIGEGCHFIDFLTFLTGSLPTSVTGQALPDRGVYHGDNVVLTFTYPDGSIGTVTYLANGDKSVAKEEIEVFCEGKTARLHDFRQLEMIANGNKAISRSSDQDKGHLNAWRNFLDRVEKGGKPPIPYREIWGVHLATFAAEESIALGKRLDLSFKGDD
jgi:predicted dehydrogenase/threonine dehydrogenase-like Zn-dependent dehydrogenase